MTAARTGLCVNVGNCPSANARKVVPVAPGQDFVCPDCGKSLVVYQPAKKGAQALIIAAAAGVVLALGGVGWWLYRADAEHEATAAAQQAEAARQAEAQRQAAAAEAKRLEAERQA
ncbi:MAG TPA: hypothetical protein PK144_15495, partial [Plasticicumulans sp.]|nr:hypothetical protein [Plasticicumulans sp.]